MEFFVNDMEAKPISSTLHLGDEVSKLLDSLNLLLQEVFLKVITKVGIIVTSSHPMKVKKRFIDALLQFQCSLDSCQGTSPFSGDRLGNILKDNPAATLMLILDQVISMLALFLGLLLEEVGKAMQSLVISVKEGCLKVMFP